MEKESTKRLKNIPIANESLYKEVAFRTKTSPKQVEECIKQVGQYIANVIKQGAFETVMIPHFGKFKPKIKKIQWMNDRGVKPRLPMLEPKTPTNEPISD